MNSFTPRTVTNSRSSWQQRLLSTTSLDPGDDQTCRTVAAAGCGRVSGTMRAAAAAVWMLVHLPLSHSCIVESGVLVCTDIPADFTPGYSSLVMAVHDVGEINSTVFRSDGLASVSRLRMENAGVMGIAEGAFRSLQNLTNLILSKNLLTEVNPNWFGRPEVLSEIILAENQIRTLTELTFKGLVGLTSLSLGKNQITTVDPNSFSSQADLLSLDLSGNRLMQVPPQVLRSFRSTKVRLDGNPWDCSCGAEDFVESVKGLHNRSLLERPLQVTCETPASLKGRPVWDVSACVTSPPPGPQSGSPPVPVRPSAVPTASTVLEHSDRPVPTHLPTPAPSIHTGASGSPGVLRTPGTNSPGTPGSPGTTGSPVTPGAPGSPDSLGSPCATPGSFTSTIIVLVLLTVVQSLLLLAVCVLVLLRRRKHSIKAVMPGHHEENGNVVKGKEEVNVSGGSEPPEPSEKTRNSSCTSGVGWRRSFSGVRAKSANAVLVTSPFSAPPVENQTASLSECRITANQAEGRETEAEDGASESMATLTKTDVDLKRSADGGNVDEDSLSASVNADAVPYLSIGRNHNKEADFGKGQGWQTGKGTGMGRICTWPPTAAQWLARCKRMEEEGGKEEGEVGSGIFTVWTQQFAGDGNREDHSTCGGDGTEERQMLDQMEKADHQVPNQQTPAHTEEREKPEVNETQKSKLDKSGQTRRPKPTGKKPRERGIEAESSQAASSKQRPADSSSQAPSGPSTPDDETLLSGNEYAFIDLLHEVVQNNGRWTRERWRQRQSSKQKH